MFSLFKEHVEKSEEKLKKIKDKEEKNEYFKHITGLFMTFCPIFFNEINKTPARHEIWNHIFPAEWKIKAADTKNVIPRVILQEFLRWSQPRIFQMDEKVDFDKDLTEVITGIFPTVDSFLFPPFLMLFFSEGVKDAIERKPNFYFLRTNVVWSTPERESDEGVKKRADERANAKNKSRKKETINIIFNFFHSHWHALQMTTSDSNKKEWEDANNEKKKSMLKIAQKKQLTEIKTEIESNEIKSVCKDDDQKEGYRKRLLELIKLLLKKIE